MKDDARNCTEHPRCFTDYAEIPIPDDCVEGVLENLNIIRSHIAVIQYALKTAESA